MSIYTFQPIYREKMWGGQRFKEYYRRDLPEGKAIGESWELVDREGMSSELTKPEGKMKTLHDLWEKKREAVFGLGAPQKIKYFPLLLKLLDCKDKLSVQVHPPQAQAQTLGGEPKAELWYFLDVERGGCVYAGLKKGVTREVFTKALGTPQLEELLHVLHPQMSDCFFLPSGRVHSIGQGNLIFEIQQNSDTTYRVDDWGRVDAEGQARQLHVEEALTSINFKDHIPSFNQPHGECVVECPYFSVYRSFLFPEEERVLGPCPESFRYHFVVQGEVDLPDANQTFEPGSGFLVTADHESYELQPSSEGAEVVTVQWGRS